MEIHIPPPAIHKPRQLWTGKQLLSSVVSHFSRGRPPITFSIGSKVPLSYWGNNSDEGDFVFHKGQLLCGCLDKAQFGKFGLVHAMQVGLGGGEPESVALPCFYTAIVETRR